MYDVISFICSLGLVVPVPGSNIDREKGIRRPAYLVSLFGTVRDRSSIGCCSLVRSSSWSRNCPQAQTKFERLLGSTMDPACLHKSLLTTLARVRALLFRRSGTVVLVRSGREPKEALACGTPMRLPKVVARAVDRPVRVHRKSPLKARFARWATLVRRAGRRLHYPTRNQSTGCTPGAMVRPRAGCALSEIRGRVPGMVPERRGLPGLPGVAAAAEIRLLTPFPRGLRRPIAPRAGRALAQRATIRPAGWRWSRCRGGRARRPARGGRSATRRRRAPASAARARRRRLTWRPESGTTCLLLAIF